MTLTDEFPLEKDQDSYKSLIREILTTSNVTLTDEFSHGKNQDKLCPCNFANTTQSSILHQKSI